ncbi:MAG: 16S rRNA (adenine(1518)-N(6)/adenine(1519)-N(6))-dimethyltransferase RsmA [Bacillota bacterium]|nr:16S rRNA (adenine(1518)-N(6)/adenine(1519)-N(6))-dimethyltransferase RsmA [Bacillota bacterium]
MDLCNIDEIKTVLLKNGFRFSKSLGQNFLTASWVPERIAQECGANAKAVLEVGPGFGCLTAELAKRAEKVIAVELDRALLPVLRETVGEYENLEIITGDILKLDIKKICAEKAGSLPLVACANLPYYITTPVLTALFESGVFETVTVMVQKEVADRLTAEPGTKAYGSFTVYAEYHAEAEVLFDVSADCFMPKPKVSSAVVRFKMHDRPTAFISDKDMFFKVVRAAFSQRRKTLANSLSSAFSGSMGKERILDIIQECGFRADIRGERLSLKEFANISNKMKDELIKIS